MPTVFIACLPSRNIKICCLILLWTGDYVAQSEVGKFIKSGVLPCRRDKLKGVFINILNINVNLIMMVQE